MFGLRVFCYCSKHDKIILVVVQKLDNGIWRGHLVLALQLNLDIRVSLHPLCSNSGYRDFLESCEHVL